jgi:AcrR family transcriptional regulator
LGLVERKEREKEQRRQQIMDAGEDLFIQYGFRNTTMDQIANHCEIARGTVYLYFKNKYELFVELFVRSIESFISNIRENLLSTIETEEKLRVVGKCYLDLYQTNRNAFFLMNFHDANDSEDAVPLDKIQYLMQKNQELWNIIVEIIEEGKTTGIFREDVNSNEISVLLWSTSNGIILTMDHMANAHKREDIKCTDDPDSSEFVRTFVKMDYISMLYKMWEMIINSIRTTKKNIN